MSKVLEIAGIIFFTLTLIGSIILIINALSERKFGEILVNYSLIAYAISSIIIGVMTLLICLALGDILKQNKLIMEHLKISE